MNPNLFKIDFAEKQKIIDQTSKLANTPQADAYQLSMPLIIASILGEQDLFTQTRQNMLEALKNDLYPTWVNDDNKSGVKAWLFGRMLQSANMLNLDQDATEAAKALQEHLNKDSNRFNAWALGYFAANSYEDYKATQASMKEQTEKLMNHYLADNKASLSDVLWVCIMALPASAKANDRDTYEFYLDIIKKLVGGTNDNLNTFTQKLFYKFPADDYRAWGLASMRLAASMIDDEGLFSSLEPHVNSAIKADDAPLHDQLLAQVNNELAKLLKQRPLRAPKPI